MGAVVIKTPRLQLGLLLTVVEELREAIRTVKPGELIVIEIEAHP